MDLLDEENLNNQSISKRIDDEIKEGLKFRRYYFISYMLILLGFSATTLVVFLATPFAVWGLFAFPLLLCWIGLWNNYKANKKQQEKEQFYEAAGWDDFLEEETDYWERNRNMGCVTSIVAFLFMAGALIHLNEQFAEQLPEENTATEMEGNTISDTISTLE